ncbi:MAG: desulfoferrodoxin [Ruminococcus sp.]|nr:desulfoferrodoxin [Ruminococcus sp.]
MKLKFYICSHCGQIIAKIKDKGVPVMCCGEPMKELVPGTTEAATEKHIPVYTVDGNTVNVTVGSVEHPMTEAHYIEWILLETKNGNQRKVLTPSDLPKASFALLPGDEVVAVYAYCNLHGLWQG